MTVNSKSERISELGMKMRKDRLVWKESSNRKVEFTNAFTVEEARVQDDFWETFIKAIQFLH